MNNNKALKPKKKIIQIDNTGVDNPKEGKNGNRRNKYEYWLSEDGLILIQGWAREGLTIEQMAKNMGITTPTLFEWKKRFDAIGNTLKKTREIVDNEVENALFKRAVGYKFTEVTKERVAQYDEHGHITGYQLVVTKEILKEISPDPVAQIFWLKNRRKDLWRNFEQQEVTLNTGPNEMHVTLIDQLKNRKLKEMMNEEPPKETKDDTAKQ